MFVVRVKGGYYLTGSGRITPAKRDAFRHLDPRDARIAANCFKSRYNKKAKVLVI